jgi:hypothetical protein
MVFDATDKTINTSVTPGRIKLSIIGLSICVNVHMHTCGVVSSVWSGCTYISHQSVFPRKFYRYFKNILLPNKCFWYR